MRERECSEGTLRMGGRQDEWEEEYEREREGKKGEFNSNMMNIFEGHKKN